jgi:hypothetical protein
MKVSKIKYNGAQVYNNLPHKFLVEMRHLAPTIPELYYLNDEQRDMAINDAVVQFNQAVIKKNIDTSDYQNYKNYQYIVLKNSIKRINIRVNLTKKSQITENVDVELDVMIDEDNFEIKQLIQQLNDEEKNIINKLIQGYIWPEIAKEKGWDRNQLTKYMKKLRKKLFPNFKVGVKKYDTRNYTHKTKVVKYVKPEIDYNYNDFYAD